MSQESPVNRVSQLTQPTDSYGRTDGRTDEESLTADYQETVSNAHTRVEAIPGFTSVGEVIAAGELWRTEQRHPVVRTGEREEIPRHVRAAVWYRDRGECDECPSGYHHELLQLDHIAPWSAGGPDTTENLRLLCQRHNEERSNFVDFAKPKRPATWWCHRCYALDEHVWHHTHPLIDCPKHGSALAPTKVRCRVGRAYAAAWLNGEPRPTWHERPPLTSFEHIAYCAHCNAPGMTGVLL